MSSIPYPRARSDYTEERVNDRDLFEDEPIENNREIPVYSSDEEVYERTPDPEEEDGIHSPTGDDPEFLRNSGRSDERLRNPYAPEYETDDTPSETHSDTYYETQPNEYDLPGEYSDDDPFGGLEGKEREKAQHDFLVDLERRQKEEQERAWFQFRLNTAQSPNEINGISKKEFFLNGYDANYYNSLAEQKSRANRIAKRRTNNIKARNGFEIGWRPPAQPMRPASAAPRRNARAAISDRIEQGYDMLGLNGMMAGAMNYDGKTQQSLSNSVFGDLPAGNGSYDVLGIGFATNEGSSGGGSVTLGDIFGFRDAPRRGAAPAGEIPDLFGFRNSAAPRRRSPAKKPKAAAKKPARKAVRKSKGTTTPPKPASQKKPAKIRKQSPPISKKATSAKKTTVKKISGGKKTTTKKFSPRGGSRKPAVSKRR